MYKRQTQYQVFRDGVFIDTAPSNSYSNITGLVANQGYNYRITACDNVPTCSGMSNTASATTAPATPSTLAATAVSDTRIDLAWTASTGATQYQVFRDGVFIATAVTNSYSNTTGLSANTGYNYRITACDAVPTCSGLSNTASATTAPGSPGGFSATAVSDTAINLAWTASTGAIHYLVTRNGTLIATVIDPAVTHNDTGLIGNTLYNYTVQACSALTCSTAALASATTAPATPSTLAATAMSDTRIDLAWTASTGATQYQVFRGGVFIDTALTNSYSNITGLTGNTPYSYTVTACNALPTCSRSRARRAPPRRRRPPRVSRQTR